MMLLFQAGNWQTFTPDLNDLWLGLGGSVVLFFAFAAGGFMLYGRKTEDARVKVVLPMLMYMAALLALVSAGGHFLTSLKYPEISISTSRISVNGNEHPRPRPDAIRIETVSGQLDGSSQQILLLQIAGGKTLALPDDRYPVPEIMQLLKK